MHLVEIVCIVSEQSAGCCVPLCSGLKLLFLYILHDFESWILYAVSCCVMMLAMY